MAVCCFSGLVQVFGLSDLHVLGQHRFQTSVESVSMHPCGRWLAGVSKMLGIAVLDVRTGEYVYSSSPAGTWRRGELTPLMVAWAPHNPSQLLASGSLTHDKAISFRVLNFV